MMVSKNVMDFLAHDMIKNTKIGGAQPFIFDLITMLSDILVPCSYPGRSAHASNDPISHYCSCCVVEHVFYMNHTSDLIVSSCDTLCTCVNGENRGMTHGFEKRVWPKK